MSLLLEMFTYPFILRAFVVGILVALCAALLGVPLVNACGKVGALVILGLGIFICLMFLTGSTLVGLYSGMVEKPARKVSEAYSGAVDTLSQRMAEAEPRRPKFNIDVPMPTKPPVDPLAEEEDEEEDDRIKVAVIGKPNVGKSSLVNLILGEKRVIVSNVAGTTRDSVDTRFENKYGKYIFVDTAGIRRKSRVDDRIEKFSVMRAKLAIERADVCLIMIDARDGVTEQDTKIAGLAHEAGKASIIVVNKWDLVDKETGTMEKMRKDVLRDLSFMSYAPVLFISALTGQRTERLFELINFVNDQSAMRITTGMLNNVLADAQARVQPPTDKGRRLKIYYMTQTGVKPPCFVVFCNSRELFHFSYQRYLENQIRAVFGLEGTPIRMVIRQKGEQE